MNDRAPFGYENWHRYLTASPARYGEEVPLYSDAHITGEIVEGWGPYQALNAIGVSFQPACVPVIFLRIFYHLSPADEAPDFSTTDTSRYIRGGVAEEIAALLGLRMGIRLRPGGKTRDIDIDPPQERPRAEDPQSIPTLSVGYNQRLVLPTLRRTVKLVPELLRDYTTLQPVAAVALVRAAILYQHGLWLCESNPSDAWLMFVSAVEVAAIQWRAMEHDDDARKLLLTVKPKWVERLERTGDAAVVDDMAHEWVSLLGSTSRFIKFLMAHLAPPPTIRPKWCIVDWEKSAIKKAFNAIYDYRSTALHGGIPFPAPMCGAPHGLEDGAFCEKPIGLASASGGGVWTAEDLPMNLHIFEYIVRNALLNWWNGMKQSGDV